MHADNSIPSFDALGVPTKLSASLATNGIASPFPIQTATLPDTLAGRDVLGRGRTGSGKTLAFSLPVVARLAGLVPSGSTIPNTSRPGHPRALVLAPTRELATQIAATLTPLAQAAGLRVMTIFGGVSENRQIETLRRGVDIVVATPGRLEDLMRQRHVALDAVAVTVLDEADHMADLGFLPGVTRILKATPVGTQRLLFSATLDAGVDKLVKQFLNSPLVHSVDSAESPVAAMVHHVFLVGNPTEKAQLVHTLAGGVSRRLLFTRTKQQAKKLARQLTSAGIPAVELHGNLSQNARERGLAAFASGGVRVMVATDIAARGIHVDDVELVVHVDPPAEHKAYLHRSGRTARAGNGGDVVTLVLPEQRRDFSALARAAKISVEPAPVRAKDERVRELVGEVAPAIEPHLAHASAARRPLEDAPGHSRPGRTGGSSQRFARPAGPGGNSGRGSSGSRGGGQRRSDDGRPASGSTRGGASRGSGNGGSRGAAAGSSRGASSGTPRGTSSGATSAADFSRSMRSVGRGGAAKRRSA